jgi:hypothetical protein
MSVRALRAYRHLLQAQRYAFRGDTMVVRAAAEQTRTGFDEHRLVCRLYDVKIHIAVSRIMSLSEVYLSSKTTTIRLLCGVVWRCDLSCVGNGAL